MSEFPKVPTQPLTLSACLESPSIIGDSLLVILQVDLKTSCFVFSLGSWQTAQCTLIQTICSESFFHFNYLLTCQLWTIICLELRLPARMSLLATETQWSFFIAFFGFLSHHYFALALFFSFFYLAVLSSELLTSFLNKIIFK